ncbi:hypothetical protein BCR44DRAFT_1076892 [Catenaria anguillulae PL171]|uniref:RING-type domain-containing protein n=1 Tax=Catenaria anguillulae PL171 TaxID=765915 RepID=A0A1Y2HR57_9FUNG|nr:hypothetical protein BCR44DRAFT_1076892 [Catenaria anguillulae PL171]
MSHPSATPTSSSDQSPPQAPPAHPPQLLRQPPLADPDLRTTCTHCHEPFNHGVFRWWSSTGASAKTNCVHCGSVVCKACASTKLLVPKFGYLSKPERVCDFCVPAVSLEGMSESELAQQPVHALKAYILAYQLPGYPFVEKADMVQAIVRATRVDVSDERERKFRLRRRLMGPKAKLGDTPRPPPSEAQGTERPSWFGASSSSHSQQQQAPRPQPAAPTSSSRESSSSGTSNTNRSRARSQPPPNFRQSPQSPPTTSSSNMPPPPPPSTAHITDAELLAALFAQLNASGRAPPAPAQPAHKPQVDPDLPSIKMLVEAHADPLLMNAKVLKGILKANHVDYSQVLEKSELAAKVSRLMDEYRRVNLPRKVGTEDDGTPTAAGDAESGARAEPVEECKVCMDNPIDCVLLECGHVGVCANCAEAMFQCPFCRERIVRVVRTFHA